MLALPELQTQLVASILDHDAEVAGAVAADGLSPAARLRIYGNHVFTSLTEALEATYPVVCRLVDRRFFGFAADRYIRRHPPGGPCLHEYGADFPDFLEGFPPCAGHPYLGDVARLEWAMNAALHADEVAAIEPVALATVASSSVGQLVFRMDPSAFWLESRWPVDRIWRANQPEASLESAVDLAAGPARLEIRRRGDVVTLRRLEPAELRFRAALQSGATLETATDAACREEARFDLTPALRALLAEGLVASFALEPVTDGTQP
ncbi:MAG: DNA-binding domain-containing protein [Candidatus Rokuibacteriota bacterium]